MQAKSDSVPGNVLWADFTCDFSKEGLSQITGDQAIRIRSILMNRGIQIQVRRGLSRKLYLIEFWEMDECPTIDNIDDKDRTDGIQDRVNTVLDAAGIAVYAAEEAKRVSSNLENKTEIDDKEDSRKTRKNDMKALSAISSPPNSREKRSYGIQALVKIFTQGRNILAYRMRTYVG